MRTGSRLLAFVSLLVLPYQSEGLEGLRVTPYKIVANIGYDGTDNDVTAKLCVGTACCTTHTLNSIWTNDWSSMDEETWGASWLGQCSGTTFRKSGSNRMTVRLLKDSGSDSLQVDNLQVHVRTPLGTETFFSCGTILMKTGETSSMKTCSFLGEDEDGENEDTAVGGSRDSQLKKNPKKKRVALVAAFFNKANKSWGKRSAKYMSMPSPTEARSNIKYGTESSYADRNRGYGYDSYSSSSSYYSSGSSYRRGYGGSSYSSYSSRGSSGRGGRGGGRGRG